jgi:hypothetical protein
MKDTSEKRIRLSPQYPLFAVEGYKWKTNTIPILMHRMCISTDQVSSVVLGPKKQIFCHDIKPNPSKDKAMHEGDNPSF